MSLLRNIKSWLPFHTRLYKVQGTGSVVMPPLCLFKVCSSLPKRWDSLPIPQRWLFPISTRPRQNALLIERLLTRYKYLHIHLFIPLLPFFLWKCSAVNRKHSIWVPHTVDRLVTFSQSRAMDTHKHCMLHVTNHTQGTPARCYLTLTMNTKGRNYLSWKENTTVLLWNFLV